MDGLQIIYLAVTLFLVTVLITLIENWLDARTASRSARDYMRQISEAGEEGRWRMERTSDNYLKHVRDITRR
jgi:signal transduction histidine kinase